MPTIQVDASYWQNCKPPLCPNDEEIKLYKNLIGDSSPVCLLGMTKSLAKFSHLAVDIVPVEDIGIPYIKCNWNNLTGKYGAIIGDGVLNLEGLQLVEKMLRLSNKFIARVFLQKQPNMKYATIFPTEFPGSKSITITQKDIAIVAWEAT